MGGSSLAPEVICATAGKPLVVLDSSDPDYVRRALGDDLEHTVVVVSSKSGSTVETDSQRRAYEQAFTDAGIDPASRIVIVTDPGSPLDKESRAKGYRVVNADPDVGGRYSALTAFGLVPSGLAGVDVEALLDEAESVADLLAADDDANPGLRLGAAMGGTEPLRDKLVLVDDGSGIVGFADWAEQLIAESTGKNGTGVLPVVVEGDEDPEVRLARGRRHRGASRGRRRRGGPVGRRRVARYAWAAPWVPSCSCGRWPPPSPGACSASTPSTSPTSRAPRRPPAPCSTREPAASTDPAATDGAIEIRALGGSATGSATHATVPAALDALFAQLDPEHGYVAVMAYLDRLGRRRPRRVPRPARPSHRASDDLRLGPTLPALDRPVPQGRPGGRRLPPDHDGTQGGPRDPRTRVHLR